ncbi:MAG: DUF4395 domain-containing protein [Chloroflexi bacterium]|nr:MAG: DUF4395 domain-containing protein [Chloroflexota bacterium]
MSSSSATSDTTPPPQGRLIDPRGHRFGAGVSVVLLTLAYLLNLPVVVGAVAVALAVSAIFGTRYSALGRPWPYVRRALNIAPPKELEGEYPPRFAQALGSVVLAVAIVLFLVGEATLAWLPVGLVVGLQTLLAVTGFCLGCRLYFLRWWRPWRTGKSSLAS